MLSTPTPHGPPSSIISILPCRSWKTCSAVVGEGLVLALAEGAASGRSASFMRARASGAEGMRAPKVLRDAVTSGARGDGVGRRRSIVSGPGQKRWISES